MNSSSRSTKLGFNPDKPWLIPTPKKKYGANITARSYPMPDWVPIEQTQLHQLLLESNDHRWWAVADEVVQHHLLYPTEKNYLNFSKLEEKDYWNTIHIQLWIYANHYNNIELLGRLERHEKEMEPCTECYSIYLRCDSLSLHQRLHRVDYLPEEITLPEYNRWKDSIRDNEQPPIGCVDINIFTQSPEELFNLFYLFHRCGLHNESVGWHSTPITLDLIEHEYKGQSMPLSVRQWMLEVSTSIRVFPVTGQAHPDFYANDFESILKGIVLHYIYVPHQM